MTNRPTTTVRMFRDTKNKLKLLSVTIETDLEKVVNVMAEDFLKSVSKDKTSLDTLKKRIQESA